MWAIGVILYEFIAGEYPLRSKDKTSLFEKIKTGQYQLDGGVWDTVSGKVVDLIRGLLTINPAKRLTVEQAFNHEWIQRSEEELKDNLLPENIYRLRRFRRAQKCRQHIRKLITTIISIQRWFKMKGFRWRNDWWSESNKQRLPVIGQYKYFSDAKEGANKMFPFMTVSIATQMQKHFY
jgi:serine/threonine protein kinase